ncbi:MAG: insulinase family protein [Bacteroidaceae bacterium]|nr:insulinase family protein [Bacteroidaceae bacterium]
MELEIPQIKAMEMADIKLPHKMQLENGIPLYLINEGVHDIIRLDILFRGGYAVQEQPLQALFTNRMLREGSTSIKAGKISRTLDSCGAWIESYCSQQCNHITLYTLKRHFGKLSELLAEIIRHPAFPEKNLDTVRSANKSHFMINSQKVGAVAQRHFEKALWGEGHKFGRLVCADDYDAIKAEHLHAYHRNVYGSKNCTIFLSGKIDDTVTDIVSATFGKEQWGTQSIPTIVDTPPLTPTTGRINIKIDDAMQSAIKIGHMALEASHPDFYALKYMTVLLGGFFGSRLMTNIRERNGYTYHIEADMSAFGKRNAFVVSSETTNEYVEPLIAEVYNEFGRLIEERVPDEEMNKLRNCTLGELCREYEGAIPKADIFINTWLSGEDFSGVNRYLETIRSCTAEDFMSLAQKYLVREKMTEVVAGA